MRAIDEVSREVTVTYFYRSQDPAGRRARDLLAMMARRNPLLKVVAVDPDREPELAREQGIQLYNAAVVEAEGRRVLVQGTDETEIAIGIQRALRGRAITACFLEGHGELPMDNFEYHTHLEGGAGHSHDDASSQVVEMPGHGVGRLRRALEAQGYESAEARPRHRGRRARPSARSSSRPIRGPRSCRLRARPCAPICGAAGRRSSCSTWVSCSNPGSPGSSPSSASAPSRRSSSIP